MRTARCVVMTLNVAGSLLADEDWWQFRGPTGEGHTNAKQLLLTWNENRKIVWKNHVEGKYSASPIHADNRIYFFNENAVCTVIRPRRKFEELAVNRLNEQRLLASPAIAGDSLFIRTETHLYRVEETTP
jgi:hypothetical protein